MVLPTDNKTEICSVAFLMQAVFRLRFRLWRRKASISPHCHKTVLINWLWDSMSRCKSCKKQMRNESEIGFELQSFCLIKGLPVRKAKLFAIHQWQDGWDLQSPCQLHKRQQVWKQVSVGGHWIFSRKISWSFKFLRYDFYNDIRILRSLSCMTKLSVTVQTVICIIFWTLQLLSSC